MKHFSQKVSRQSEQRTLQKIKRELYHLDKIEKRLAEVEKLLTDSIQEVEKELEKT
ncbi:MAG TPA: hypothetical protein VJB91_02090 [Patescibacteria group bacterium]|nr:hypothetical protein [Patescibacteria group bacterium]